eukprot:1734921-Karenia_brevis.AAC.1
MLIHEDYKKLRDYHLQGAATEFGLHKMWELVQFRALERKRLGAQAHTANVQLNELIADLGSKVQQFSELPHGIEQAQQARLVWDQWLKLQMPKVHHAQEITGRTVNRKHNIHPTS